MQSSIIGLCISRLNFHRDSRGWLTEIYRADDLATDALIPKMAYVSETLPGCSRGPHEHARQTDIFIFLGPGNLDLYLWDNRKNSISYKVHERYYVGAANPCQIIVPPGIVHGYYNASPQRAIVINATNQLYRGVARQEEEDTIRYEDAAEAVFKFIH
jgi:dTDP-4-dehydrorhamnose 3,5-epimerase